MDRENVDAPILEVRIISDWYRAALVDQSAIDDPHELEALARPICEDLSPCRVGLWFDASKLPNMMPVAESQMQRQVFAFGRNPEGRESALWNCNVFPEFETERLCLPRALR